ncbi:hypothetical protein ABIB45_001976 [Arthrobacter sp. UYCo732]
MSSSCKGGAPSVELRVSMRSSAPSTEFAAVEGTGGWGSPVAALTGRQVDFFCNPGRRRSARSSRPFIRRQLCCTAGPRPIESYSQIKSSNIEPWLVGRQPSSWWGAPGEDPAASQKRCGKHRARFGVASSWTEIFHVLSLPDPLRGFRHCPFRHHRPLRRAQRPAQLGSAGLGWFCALVALLAVFYAAALVISKTSRSQDP